MKKSNIFLILGLVVLLIGSILSLWNVEPYADYVLVAGAILIIIRGGIYAREKSDASTPSDSKPDSEE